MPEFHADTAGVYDAARVAHVCAKTPGVLRVWVYGSAVWGGYTPGVSDLDLMVEGEGFSVLGLTGKLADVLPGTVDVRIAATLTWHHQADIRARGILIYDRDSRESAGAHGTDAAG